MRKRRRPSAGGGDEQRDGQPAEPLDQEEQEARGAQPFPEARGFHATRGAAAPASSWLRLPKRGTSIGTLRRYSA